MKTTDHDSIDNLLLREGGYPHLPEAPDHVADVTKMESVQPIESMQGEYEDWTAYPRPALAVKAAFPERDLTKPAEQQGVFNKFIVRRVDGSDANGGKHHGCRYFVLDLDHDVNAPAAMRAYAEKCKESHPALSQELFAQFGQSAQPEQEPINVTNSMAYAFHRALTDGTLSENELEEIKIGLRAALCNLSQPATQGE
ncbi:hypothetical protein [Undibacterium macrobrachii]|uniref:Uncharacterized protein n=1 Tax=Undibacterium macrobrachii TaxID=1119058 RepID=A0ABQ2X6E8_9BURK|nr:hypothetical protein [Undibacterium macrobrachii]GGX01692.1 hypothetical protein GCM10011282_04550 [Undibacterium macrobrachii]